MRPEASKVISAVAEGGDWVRKKSGWNQDGEGPAVSTLGPLAFLRARSCSAPQVTWGFS